MAMKHYNGVLGEFDYNDAEFKVVTIGESENKDNTELRYIGTETDGSKIHIPDGLNSCAGMFWNRTSIKTAPEIPNSVRSCLCMFSGCKVLETAPVIPDGVETCYRMFSACESLTTVPIIPKSVKNCEGMFIRCKSLETAPVIPKSVTCCYKMFDGCSNEIQKAGLWNVEHRGYSYDDYMTKKVNTKFVNNRGSEFDDTVVQDDTQKGLGE